jgi:hypothetical protein
MQQRTVIENVSVVDLRVPTVAKHVYPTGSVWVGREDCGGVTFRSGIVFADLAQRVYAEKGT